MQCFLCVCVCVRVCWRVCEEGTAVRRAVLISRKVSDVDRITRSSKQRHGRDAPANPWRPRCPSATSSLCRIRGRSAYLVIPIQVAEPREQRLHLRLRQPSATVFHAQLLHVLLREGERSVRHVSHRTRLSLSLPEPPPVSVSSMNMFSPILFAPPLHMSFLRSSFVKWKVAFSALRKIMRDGVAGRNWRQHVHRPHVSKPPSSSRTKTQGASRQTTTAAR